MKKCLVLIFITAAISTSAFSQTKKIAHRSHSGSDASFTIKGGDNFGLPSKEEQDEWKKRMDSLKKKRDTLKKTADTLQVKSPNQKNKKKKLYPRS